LSLSVYDLAVEVVLYLVAFQRRVADGEELNYEDTRAEVLALLNDLDQRSHGEPGLWDNWTKARAPLVYLIDEVMILNCNWAHRDRWADECLEVALLGHPEALGGENFYTEADEALRELELAERHERHDYRATAEIVMVYYVALQTGFKGKYALDLDAWREYKGHVFSKLPAYAQTRTKQLFPEAAEHTVVLDPNYEPVMRLLYVFIGFVLVISLYLGSTWVYWSQMVDELEEGARNAPVPTSQQVEEG
jgi:type IV/VI secretion system ImpK/VasF family protein